MKVICESMSPSRRLGIRPFCRCCSGGDIRDRHGKYRHTKAESRERNNRSRRAKPKSKEHRLEDSWT